MCACNRRSEMNEIKIVKGLEWGAAADSNARWSGILLRDVVQYAGLTEDKLQEAVVEHILFEGGDRDWEFVGHLHSRSQGNKHTWGCVACLRDE